MTTKSIVHKHNKQLKQKLIPCKTEPIIGLKYDHLDFEKPIKIK